MLWVLWREINPALILSIVSSFQHCPSLLLFHGKKKLFSEFLYTLMSWCFRIQRVLFSLRSELFRHWHLFFSFSLSSEWESAALEHCYWCEEGYKRKSMQSDYTLMHQFVFSWTDSSLGSTDLWTALIVWGAESAWKCLIMMSVLLILCRCLLVLDYGFSNILSPENMFSENITCRALPRVLKDEWPYHCNCWATPAAGKETLRQQRSIRILKTT